HLRHLLQDVKGDPDIAAVVGGRSPQPENVRAEFLDHLVRRDDVPQRLGHLAPLAVDDKAVGEHRPVRRLAPGGHRGEKRRLEPPAVLIRALEIHVGRPALVLPGLEHRRVTGAGVEPDVHDVLLLAKLAPAAPGACGPCGTDAGGAPPVPGVGTLGPEQDGHGPNALLAEQRLTARLAVDDGHGYAPGPLPGDAPVAALRHLAADAV